MERSLDSARDDRKGARDDRKDTTHYTNTLNPPTSDLFFQYTYPFVVCSQLGMYIF